MRRIGLYSDVHGNLPALTAVIDHMTAEGVSERYCLGDLVGYGPHPSEVIGRVRALGDRVVQGNYDRALGARLRDAGSSFPTPEQTLDGAESYAYTIAAVTPAEERYLSALSREIVLTVDGARILLCHGSPRRVNEEIPADAPAPLLVTLVRDAGADVVCSGHLHIPFHRSMPTESGVCHWVNAGAVGRPRDGDPRACWVELVFGTHAQALSHAPEDTSCRRVGDTDLWLSVHIHRVAYDVDSVIKDSIDRGLPATLASALKTGSEVREILAPTSTTDRLDLEGTGDASAEAADARTQRAAEATAPQGADRTDEQGMFGDRLAAYECLAAVFRDEADTVALALPDLALALQSCRAARHTDDAAISLAHEHAVDALGTPAGRAAFFDERERLFGDCRRFDPFSHVLSATELTYLSGEESANRAMLETAYAAEGFVAEESGGGCVGHIATELSFMAHCLRRANAGNDMSLDAAREFFVEHLADWAVLFAVVTLQQAREPGMRYAGLALDKFLACEAAVFRAAVPGHGESCDLDRLSGVLSSARTDASLREGGAR